MKWVQEQFGIEVGQCVCLKGGGVVEGNLCCYDTLLWHTNIVRGMKRRTAAASVGALQLRHRFDFQKSVSNIQSIG